MIPLLGKQTPTATKKSKYVYWRLLVYRRNCKTICNSLLTLMMSEEFEHRTIGTEFYYWCIFLLKGSRTCIHTFREEKSLPSSDFCFTFQISTTTGSLELSLGLLHGRDLSTWAITYCFPGWILARSWDLAAGPGLEPRHSDVGYGCPEKHLHQMLTPETDV